eukprot:13121735-Alexandrium_andersonii.AAC.1
MRCCPSAVVQVAELEFGQGPGEEGSALRRGLTAASSSLALVPDPIFATGSFRSAFFPGPR